MRRECEGVSRATFLVYFHLVGSTRIRRVIGVTTALVALSFIPECPTELPAAADGEPFVWNADARWESLEAHFVASRSRPDRCLPAPIEALRAGLEALQGARASDPRWDPWESSFQEAAALAAACPDGAAALVAYQGEARAAIRRTARAWDVTDASTRQRLYRLLQGTRAAVEEVMLQMPPDQMPVVVRGPPVASTGPCTTLHGTRVCSGDILLSRGGAPTSALIARGSDYPGSFSHVALVHVDEGGRFRTIEAHIELGVVVAGLERYEGDPKLRVMLLRLRPEDLSDSGAPHRAAEHALARAEAGPSIPYDFALDFRDHDALFCSEVASSAYEAQGVPLWRGLTTTSGAGTARWLSRFGVRNLRTQGPGDLEYDPSVAVVAEWRAPESLFRAHVDDAVVDALLEGAARGDDVAYARAELPLARLAKGWSWLRGLVGTPEPIPEGMSATVALRVEWLRARHGAMAAAVLAAAKEFEARRGYVPPYWELVAFAREAL